MSFDYKEWWKHQGDAVKERRRKKYKEDPEYREKQRRWSAEYREKQRKRASKKFRRRQREWAAKYREGLAGESHHTGRRPVMVTVTSPDGEVAFKCWTVGRLASEIGRTVDFIDMLERRAQMPESPFRSEEGYRYYTDEMIQGVKRALMCRQRVRKTDWSLYFEIVRWWTKSGVMSSQRVLDVNAMEQSTGG